MSALSGRDDLARVLGAAERSIALIDRCRPTFAAREREALLDDWHNGRPRAPRVRYAPVPDLSELRRGLEALAERLDSRDPWTELYGARAAELAFEAALVGAIGRAEFSSLAARRFGAADGEADAMAARWAALPSEEAPSTSWSDDERDPGSLVSRMRAEVSRLCLPFRVIASEEVDSAAAVGDGVIVVRARRRHSQLASQRIVAHEIQAHALPRHRAATDTARVLACATAGASDDEEGRALLIERRLGLCDQTRRRELGFRHLAARSAHCGADWVETARRLVALGCGLEPALEITARAHRGGVAAGGLGREAVYLPALLRVETAFAIEPAIEHWFERGRVGVHAARVLEGLGGSKFRRVAPQLRASREVECGATRR